MLDRKWTSVLLGEAFPHFLVLGLCLAMMIGAALLRPASPQKRLFKSTKEEQVHLGKLALPEMCIMKQATGFPCPGCGLTRSWVSLMHGRLMESINHHRLGLAVWVYALCQLLRHAIWLLIPRLRRDITRAGAWLDRSILVMAFLLLVNWVWELRVLF